MNQNLSTVQMAGIPRSHTGGSRSLFDTGSYAEDIPDVSPFSGVKRAQTVQPLSAGNRTSATRETSWTTTSLRQEAPVSYSAQTKGTLFQWDDNPQPQMDR